jgi:hypothetical protein
VTLLISGQRNNMPKSYSEKFVLNLQKNTSDHIGIKMAKLCVKARLPIKDVANVFKVSRMAIHSWFRGSEIKEENVIKIQKFNSIIEARLLEGHLPKITSILAKHYLEEIVTPEIIEK